MRYYILFLLMCLPLLGQAQIAPVWNRSYGSALNETDGLTVAMPTGGYLLLSGVEYPGSPPVSLARSLLFVRTNAMGDTLWTKKMTPRRTSRPYPSGLTLDNAGNVLVTGYESSGNGYGFWLKLNPSGDTIWTKLVKATGPTGLFASFGRVVIAPDGNYLGGEGKLYSAPGPSGYTVERKAIKYDALTGTPLWSVDLTPVLAAYGFDPRYSSGTFTTRVGSNYLFGLQALTAGPNSVGMEGTFNISDVNGSISHLRYHPFAYNNSYPQALTTSDGNVIVGRRQMLTKLTPTGDTLWHTLVPRRLNRDWDAASLCEDAQGNYVVAGNSHFTVGGSLSADNIHLIRFRARTGQVVNDTMLYRPGQTYASTLLRTGTGNLLIGGWYNGGIYGGSDAILAEWGAFRLLASRPQTELTSLRAFPNPADAAGATVQLPAASRRGGTLTVTDPLGRTVAQQAVAAGTAAVTLDLATLPPGLYLLRFEGGDGTRATTRLLRR